MDRKKRILIVDDESSLTQSLKIGLEISGPYQVETCNDPRHAYHVARSFRPDLIVLDVFMPGVDGGDVAAQIRSDPLFGKTPVIFLTAIVSVRDQVMKNESKPEGEHFLAKPISIPKLMEEIEKHLPGAASPSPAAAKAATGKPKKR